MAEFMLNGVPVELAADADEPLLFALRNDLGLKSPKLGCGLEQCGSCAVLIDNESRMSCQLSVQDIAGKHVETLEGLQTDVQASLGDANATQCGYCLAGIVVAATALFRANAHPSRAEILEALDPHLCRCGSQPRIIRALLKLSSEG